MHKQLIQILFLTAMAALVLSAADPLVGTWKLNAAKSRYEPGPGPKSATSVYSMDGDWVVMKVDSVAADGAASSNTNRYRRDGKDYPYRGPLGSGTISVKKIDDRHYEATLKLATGTLTAMTELSADGKVRTQTTTGTNAKGKVRNVVVYDRQ